MMLKKYEDLKNVEDNMIVDLTELDLEIAKRAIDFLAGLTCKNGSLIKLAKNRYLVRIGEVNNEQ